MGKEKVIRISANEFRYMGVFETLTGAGVKDCIVDEEKIIFIVKEGDMGLAIGKNGANVKKVEETVGRKIDLIEFSRDAVQFVKNVMNPMKPKNAYMSQKSTGQKIIKLQLEPQDKRTVLANNKRLLNTVKNYVARHHPVDDIEIA